MRYARRTRHLGDDVANAGSDSWLNPGGGSSGAADPGTVSVQDLLKSGAGSYAGEPPAWVAGNVTGQGPFAGEVSYLPSASGGPAFAVFNPENADAPGTYGAPFGGAGLANPSAGSSAPPVAVSTQALPLATAGAGVFSQPVVAAYPGFTWGWLLALVALGWLVFRES